MANVTRSPFLQAADGHLLRFLLDCRFAPNNVYFVQSTHSNAGDSPGKGQTPDAPFATIDYAVGRCESGKGDLILVLPGHVEMIDTAGGLTLDVAGVRILGLGQGRNRPTISVGGVAAAGVDVDAANVTLENVQITTRLDAITVLLDVNASDFTLRDCEFYDGTGQVDVFLLADANADRMLIEGLVYRGASAAGTSQAIALVGCDAVTIRNCEIIGNFGEAVIQCLTTAATNLRVHHCLIRNLNSVDLCILDTVTGSTGLLGPHLYLSLADNAANVTEAITGATFRLFDPIYVVNADNEKAMLINWTASTDA